MRVSVCIASYNRDSAVLREVLQSIFLQTPPFEFEVILCDDGSPGLSTKEVGQEFATLKYHRIERPPVRRNPCIARNLTYRKAVGDYLVLQSDDVVHRAKDSLEQLVYEAVRNPKSFILATVLGCGPDRLPWSEYTGSKRRVPYFFLGIMQRKHLYAVGGNDEDFAIVLGYEDRWFADCLMRGLKLSPVYTAAVRGHHLYHPRSDTDADAKVAASLYRKKRIEAEKTGIWCSAGGAWNAF